MTSPGFYAAALGGMHLKKADCLLEVLMNVRYQESYPVGTSYRVIMLATLRRKSKN